ncbi:MAG: chromate transporter [Spirochaetaceae bacterium 4572_59]|nr:MAG: chromate transporter [Spirochaetaceae bacterium 4572_59]
MNKQKKPRLSELFFLFFKMGGITFGGGYAMLPILQRELAETRKWVSEEELLDFYAIGQSTPGIIAVNTATFVGYRTAGIPGALAATAGMVTPSLIIITFIAAFLKTFSENIYVQKALRGVNISVAVLLLTSVYKFGVKSILDKTGMIICLLSFSLIIFAGWSPIPIVLLSITAGIVMHFIRKGMKG